MEIIINILLPLLGGVALFLFGMKVMGEGLEKIAGSSKSNAFGKITSSNLKAFGLGLGVTAVVQSSTATAVMAVGFVNSAIIGLSQAISIVIGSNIGSTVTAWILSLSQIDSTSGRFFEFFSISTLTPIIALVSVFIFMLTKNQKLKDKSMVFVGFGILMLGMTAMTSAVSPLKDQEWFSSLMTSFGNLPILGVLTGLVLTAIVQSSSASVGILQALALSGAIPFTTAVPIVIGDNIGKVVPVFLSTFGTKRDAKRTANAHLIFNLVGAVIFTTLFYFFRNIGFIKELTATPVNIAIFHSGFNIVTAAICLPCIKLLEKATNIGLKKREEKTIEDSYNTLDDHFISSPAIAIDRATRVTDDMASLSIESIVKALETIGNYSAEKDEEIRSLEDRVDKYEDKLGSYLVKVNSSSYYMTGAVSRQSTMILHLISDFERISDHSVNLVESAKEMYDKKIAFSAEAQKELNTLILAIREILTVTLEAFWTNDLEKATTVEPLEQVVDVLKEQIKHRHIERLSVNQCTIESGFILTDIISNLERVSDHCSNIAGCIIEINRSELDMHRYLGDIKTYDESFKKKYSEYLEKYSLENK